MTDPFVTLAQARQLATGSPLDLAAPTLAPACGSESDFDRLVTDYYKFFNEEFAGEVSFLLLRKPSSTVSDLRQLLYNLRTSTNHSDNPKAVEAARQWRKDFSTPQLAADALASVLSQGLSALARIAVEVTKDRVQSESWRDLLSIDVATVFDAVATDLSRTYTDGNRRRMVRIIEKRLEVYPPRGDRRTLVAEYCAQEMISDRRPLPVPYDQVLDALNLLGKADAEGALLAAHSVAALSPELRGDSFIARVLETWRTAAA